MKNLLFLLFPLIIACNTNDKKPTSNQENHTIETNNYSTYYLIRHAEKDRSNPEEKDPELTDIGNRRAANWVDIFNEVKFDAVYSTKYNRTVATAQPTAIAQNLKIKHYDPNDLYNSEFINHTNGKTILIVGHSNTTPAFVNKIIEENKFQDIDDNENGALFIVTKATGHHPNVQLLFFNQ